MPAVILVLIGAFIYWAWKFFAVVAITVLVLWAAKKAAKRMRDRQIARRQERADLIRRAAEQHQHILDGEFVKGHYGDFPSAVPAHCIDDLAEGRKCEESPHMPAMSRASLVGPDPVLCAAMATDVLVLDFVAEEFRYTDAAGVARRAAFPAKDVVPGLKDTTIPGLDDLAALLAAARGWASVGGQTEWWHVTFNEHLIETDTEDIPVTITLELTGCNPHKDFDAYLALRGADPILWIYGRTGRGQSEGQLSHVSNAMVGLRRMYDSIQGCLREGADNGFSAGTDGWYVRVIYRKDGEHEFSFCVPCQFEKPSAWKPVWE